MAQIAADARVINWATRLGVHPFLAQVTNDDELDALVSYLCARGMVSRPRETDWLGSHVSGGFAVPLQARASAMQRHFVNVAPLFLQNMSLVPRAPVRNPYDSFRLASGPPHER